MCIFFFFFQTLFNKGYLGLFIERRCRSTPQIFIESLEINENSGDENDCHADSLIGNQFKASACTSNEKADSTLQSGVLVTIASCNTNKKHIYTWKKERQTVEIVSFPENNKKKHRRLSPVQHFKLYFDDKTIKNIIRESTSNCLVKN